MNKKYLLVASLSINILVVFAFFAKRYYFAHSGVQSVETPFDDIWNRSRRSVQEMLTIEKGDIVFVGNSITEGFPVAEMFPGLKVKNRGIGGNRTAHLIGRIGEIARQRPDKIFVEIGTNDIRNKVTGDSICKNIAAIFDTITDCSPTTKMYFSSVFPMSMGDVKFNDTVDAVNIRLVDLCKKKGIVFIDVARSLKINRAHSPAGGELDSAYSFDGIHPNGRGYEIWADKIRPYL